MWECEKCDYWEVLHGIGNHDYREEKFKKCQNCQRIERLEAYKSFWSERSK